MGRLPKNTRTHLVKLGLLGIVLILAAAATYTSFLIVQRQQALREVSRYNLTWLVSQAALEVSRLQQATAAALVPGTGVDDDDVQLWLDIIANRTNLFDGGDVTNFVATSPDFGSIVTRFREIARAGQAVMNQPASPERLRHVLALFGPLNAPLARLAAASNSYGGELVAEDQRQLSSLHWLFAAILGALTLCAFGLIFALTMHNRLLAHARQKVEQQNEVVEERDHELRTQHAHMSFMAHHDALTGLSNRLLFHKRLEEALEQRSTLR